MPSGDVGTVAGRDTVWHNVCTHNVCTSVDVPWLAWRRVKSFRNNTDAPASGGRD
jgi:hypothetical protein